jgi:hypothetical protein
MKKVSVFYSCHPKAPFKGGLQPVGTGRFMTMWQGGPRPDGHVLAVHRYCFDHRGLTLYNERAEDPTAINCRFSSEEQDVAGVMFRYLYSQRPPKMAPEIRGPILLASFGKQFEWANPLPQPWLIETAMASTSPGWRGPPHPGTVSTGGKISQIVKDGNIFIEFENQDVLELPPEAKVLEWVQPGVATEPGTVVAELVPRKTRSKEEFMALPPETLKRIFEETMEAHSMISEDDVQLFDIRIAPRHLRRPIQAGGAVLDMFEFVPFNRQPQIVAVNNTTLRDGVSNPTDLARHLRFEWAKANL